MQKGNQLSDPIYHLASPDDAKSLENQSFYSTESLRQEGFIHCCTAYQLPGVIQRYYANTAELVLLTIDSSALGMAPVYENTVGGTELFPHIYGPIDAKAVTRARTLDQVQLQAIVSGDQID